MAIKILVMGLPGSGKTYFTERLVEHFKQNNRTIDWFNADEIRKQYDDWDFTWEGRLRQAYRMKKLADESTSDYVVCDFVAPLPIMRDVFGADWIVWMDTVNSGQYEDTNKMFTVPTKYDFRITEKQAEFWSLYVSERIANNRRRPEFDWRKETVQMLGRWQPWHKGHRALFERAIAKTGQVIIQIRDCQGWRGSNPFAVDEVTNRIRRDLDPLYQGQYQVMLVPNIVNITYGRDVGYKIEQEVFDEEIHSISATKIRREMGLE